MEVFGKMACQSARVLTRVDALVDEFVDRPAEEQPPLEGCNERKND